MKLHQILYEQVPFTNIATPMSPRAVWDGDTSWLRVYTQCHYSYDDDRTVEVRRYDVRDVALPDWLPAEEWIAECVKWRWAWGMGAQPNWPEAWQRWLAYAPDAWPRKLAAIELLSTSRFRSPFRASLREQLVTWLEQPGEEHRYNSPLSDRQWDKLVDRRVRREANQRDRALYRRNEIDLGLSEPNQPVVADVAATPAYGQPALAFVGG
ncbi:MAG: hypothetical protein KKA73_16040 [Chloroflexi bacterium]|nr:hypothetical protein [Chloroflexota bacterium]MBU1749196.1 hypothetical protein [Chloroflexota bacterium]